jgi:hypothetical protein
MNWCVIAVGGLIGVSAGLIRLAYWIGHSNGQIEGFRRGFTRGHER